jgi:hypothetical protein
MFLSIDAFGSVLKIRRQDLKYLDTELQVVVPAFLNKSQKHFNNKSELTASTPYPARTVDLNSKLRAYTVY